MSVAQASDAAVELGPPVEPGADTDVYGDAYAIYRDLYLALLSTFHNAARLDT